LDELLTVGIEKAYELAPKWNRNLGVTFGKFIEKHLWGAMRDHAKRRPKTAYGLSEDAVEAITRKSGRKAPQPSLDKTENKRWSKADAHTADYLRAVGDYPVSVPQSDSRRKHIDAMVGRFHAAGGTVKRTTPTITAELEAAIGRLNKRQQAAYRGRILSDPPKPIAEIAREQGIRDVSQISRSLRQAESKIAQWLKVSNRGGIL
jgi:hypothetical protein